MPKFVYKNYLLALLTIIGIASYFDRFIFALGLEQIKHDLQLSDSQLGLMTGFAFAAFYALAGIPIARWADRGNRTQISAAAVGLLGIMVSLSGLVLNFIQLLIARVGIAVGEAGAIPTAQSLIADYFDRGERPRAIAIYFSSFSLSMIFGYLIGGWMIEQYGWRSTFIIAGVPAIAISILAKLTLREPRLKHTNVIRIQQKSLLSVMKILCGQMTFRHIILAFCVSYFFSMGASQWWATFFMRSYEIKISELGGWLAMVGFFGVLGNFIGGYYATNYAAYKEKRQMRVVAISFIITGILTLLTYVAPNKYMALTFLALSVTTGAFVNGPIFAAIQSLVDDSIRSVTIAIVFLLANLIGLGFGPLTVGIFSDLLNPAFGDDSLRYALALLAPGSLWAACHFWHAGKMIEEDIRSVHKYESLGHLKRNVVIPSDSDRPVI